MMAMLNYLLPLSLLCAGLLYLIWLDTLVPCAECKAVRVPRYRCRCSFCDAGEGEIK